MHVERRPPEHWGVIEVLLDFGSFSFQSCSVRFGTHNTARMHVVGREFHSSRAAIRRAGLNIVQRRLCVKAAPARPASPDK